MLSSKWHDINQPGERRDSGKDRSERNGPEYSSGLSFAISVSSISIILPLYKSFLKCSPLTPEKRVLVARASSLFQLICPFIIVRRCPFVDIINMMGQV